MVKPTKKKHILFIVENNPAPNDVRVWSEARAARDFGFDVTVICPRNEHAPLEYEEVEGIAIYRHFMPFEAGRKLGFAVEYLNALFWEIYLSVRIFLRKPFHIIHSANPPDHVFIIALLYRLFGVKYIFDHHDISPENYLAKFGRKDFLYKVLLIMERLTFKTADLVISTNESYKKIAVERGGKKESDVFIVRNGPDLSSVIFAEPNEKLKDGLEYLVAYLGTIGNQEGIDILLRAIKYLVETRGIHNIKFLIIGTGPHWKEMVSLSRNMKLERFVTFTGFIPYKDLYEILATADVCVNPEFRNEFTDKSTMIKIMDYMVFGKPIVQFYTTEGHVTAGSAAVYVEDSDETKFADAIVRLLEDPKKRQQMGEIARARILESLRWEYQKVNLDSAYRHLETATKDSR